MKAWDEALALLCLLHFAGSVPAEAAENAYYVVGKSLVPLARVFVPGAGAANRAVSASLAVEQATAPADAVGRTVDIQVIP